jgi:hypothetical protein
VFAGERLRTGVNETKTERRRRRAAGMVAGCREVRGERRGDLVGAQPGPGSGRPWRAAVQRLHFVLVGLANHAGSDGTGAFPSVATLVRYTGLFERTIRTRLDRLQAAGIITRCDPDIIAARIKRADRRPQGWDLDLSLARGDLLATGPASHPPARREADDGTSRPGRDGQPDGMQSPHPAASPVDNTARGVQPLHPAASTPARGAPAVTAYVDGGGTVREFFQALGPGWRLTAAQRARLAPTIATALDSGWTPTALAAFTGANTDRVRSPYAVLAARLSPAELPAPHRRPARPPWCGECDEVTRMIGFDSDAPWPCPRCKTTGLPEKARHSSLTGGQPGVPAF